MQAFNSLPVSCRTVIFLTNVNEILLTFSFTASFTASLRQFYVVITFLRVIHYFITLSKFTAEPRAAGHFDNVMM